MGRCSVCWRCGARYVNSHYLSREGYIDLSWSPVKSRDAYLHFIFVCLLMEAVRTCFSLSRLSLTDHRIGMIGLQMRLLNQNTQKMEKYRLRINTEKSNWPIYGGRNSWSCDWSSTQMPESLEWINRRKESLTSSPLCLTHTSLSICLQKNLSKLPEYLFQL